MATLTRVKVLNPANPNKATAIFGGEASGILNWNDIAHPHFYTLRQRIRSLFWTANEVDMTQDVKQFSSLTQEEQSAFLKIIGLLATLDGPQTVIAMKIADFTTDPSVKSILATIADQESEHNHSYAYVLSSVTNLDKQMEAFEMGRTDEVLMKRNERIVDVYNEFAENPTIETVLKAMVYTTLLEGLFFYSGFAFFYNLARHQKMVGTSTMISYINRDELQHGKAISDIFRAALAENPEYNTDEFTEWIYDQFRHSVEQEVIWSRYVLAGIDGLELEEMEGYVKYRANKMLRMLGLSEIYPEFTENPMKWIRAYVDNFDDTKTDFFEQTSRQYVKTSDLNGFDDL
ncbi:ribonucleotide-diphosphate reductase subunit beta [Sporosarcina sp. P21c]|uniref:ribonucleotide-diphosphate reductase subunit beta n=1 Tax=Sporosarcina TaxID=1569 RepID=UPI000A15A0EB|nr:MULTISPECIES: ribonucleotide-diphosphate reductase subunit beta [Sporosarcina]ARJ39404.1 ribonucleotide-diphosphate reductase subunit beta [Sporosarcina ureae]PIC67663.1 ribonucleotide-diphosphate reductase subunit beta [Sporosarcina sp. P16a]PIC83539.1 ribonucleotide-diphosphate reductase subunit beta [Sporosarcina sp. P1]PIC89290.1 ribonucleotide-diphosphate reductase subunit beta [Sporosarcina sp. P21c]PIC93114.1 ribonucleotide-diphosphate reductase subunit beta [Sporosarcina sp. P25]